MSGARVLFYVQHLLGVGHLKRAALIARALAGRGFEVDLVSGGLPVAGIVAPGVRLIQLPPARSRDEAFTELVDADGAPVGEAWESRRRARLLALFAESRPEVLVVETFPFGRRRMRFELLPLLDAAAAARPRPLVVASVRDILQLGRKPGRAAEAADIVRDRFDHVLVHGDPSFARFDETFPAAAKIADRLHHTGFVAEPARAQGAVAGGRHGVVVSTGGGAVGRALLDAALAARPLSPLGQAPWRLIAGSNLGADELAAIGARAPAGVTVERDRSDFGALLAAAAVSVSQCGYNTVMDVLRAEVPAVVVPFAGTGETEQPMRAARLAERGLVRVVAEAALAPESLATAIAAALATPPPSARGLDLDGAAKSARLIAGWLAERRGRAA